MNSSETSTLELPKVDSSSFFNQHRKKSAAEAATSILKDLGINKSLENEAAESKAGNIDSKAKQKIHQTYVIILFRGDFNVSNLYVLLCMFNITVF